MSELAERFRALAETREFKEEYLRVDLAQSAWSRMRQLGITQAELARRMNVSRARVNQILRGSDNLTLRTLTRLSAALESELRVQIGERPLIKPPIANPARLTDEEVLRLWSWWSAERSSSLEREFPFSEAVDAFVHWLSTSDKSDDQPRSTYTEMELLGLFKNLVGAKPRRQRRPHISRAV